MKSTFWDFLQKLILCTEKIFGEIVIPSAVFNELTLLPKNQSVPLDQITWIESKRVINIAAVKKLMIELDPGESEATILSEELSASLLIIDEAKGRKIAKARGLPITGLLGVLLEVKQMGELELVTLIMEELIQKVHFRIHPNLVEIVKKRANE